MSKKFIKHFLWIVPLFLILCCIAGFGFYVFEQTKTAEPTPLDDVQQFYYESEIEQKYSEFLTGPLPYPVTEAKLFLYAKAGIIIDASNGCILYAKNADDIIPPASMTKIAAMYVVFQAIENGETTLDTVVNLVPDSWAKNAPPQSSLMGLDENQIVTVNELLIGLAVASGNDAATALAYHIAGSIEAFCDRMNKEMQSLGLKNTFFVDASGYSEFNSTTPREFAGLARIYIQKYPEALKKYHSIPYFTFPQKSNYPENYKDPIPSKTIYATNRLLQQYDGGIEGCDGLKTGFIYESGFNISLTAKRNNTRFISVTMGGPGVGTIEGNRYRMADGKKLMKWAFDSFETHHAMEKAVVPVRVWQGKENAINVIEAKNHSLSVPNITPNAASKVKRKTVIYGNVVAPVQVGDVLGKAQYSVDGVLLEEIPLIADRTVLEGSNLKKIADSLAQKILSKRIP